MAKQYIPGVSGLLTEPNPADSPSNTLSEAENVVVDQNGKIQARHGINITDKDRTTSYALPGDTSESYYANWQIQQVNRALGSSQVDMYGGSFVETFTDNITYSSFYENGGYFFKFFEAKNSNDEILSGFLVKQSRNQYGPIAPSGITQRFLVDKGVSDIDYIYYQLNPETGKIEKSEKINYREITDIFNTKTGMYLLTEDGLAESNVDDMFRPTENRFFTIQWPAYPNLTYTITKSSLYQNWLKAGHRCGIRFTFYREMGYTDNDTGMEIYESAPSRVYEIYNTGEDGIPTISLDFSAVLDSDDFKRYNLFTRFNNGRKFGIKLYRTTSKPLLDSDNESIPLGDEYFQCYDSIPFDSLFTSSFDLGYVSPYSPLYGISDSQYWFRFNDYGKNSIYRPEELQGEYNIGDTISYILNDSDLAGNKLYNRYIISANQKSLTQFNAYESFTKIDENDYIPAKLEIADKTVSKTQIEVSLNDSNVAPAGEGYLSNFNIRNETIQRTRYDEYYTPSTDTAYTDYIGFTIKNTEDFDKFVNQANLFVELNNNAIPSWIDFASNPTIPASPNNYLKIVRGGTEFIATLPSGSQTISAIASAINSQLLSNGIFAYSITIPGGFSSQRLFIARTGTITQTWTAVNTFSIKNEGAASVLFGGAAELPLSNSSIFDLSYRRVIFRPGTAIKLEIWEYEDKPSGFTASNPYLTLTRRITTGETVFAGTDYQYSTTFEKYLEDPSAQIYFNPSNSGNANRGFHGLIKVNFNQDFVFKSGKSYFCSISTKNFVNNEFAFRINAVSNIRNIQNPYNVDIFRWSTDTSPKYVRTITNTNTSSFIGYNITFGKQITKYAYKLKAVGNVIDSFGKNTTLPVPLTFTGTTTISTTIYTDIDVLSFNIPIGSTIVGKNIPINSVITNVASGFILISNNCTANESNVSFTVYSHSGTILYAYNPNTKLLNTEQKSLYLSRPNTSTSDPLTSLTTNVTFDASTDRFTIKDMRLKNGQYIRFVQDYIGAPTPPTGINLNQWYAIQNVIVDDSTILQTLNTYFDIGITFTTPSTGTLRAQILANEALTDNRYFIRNFNIPLELNDTGITSIEGRLYTDKNLDGATNTNLIAPNCKVIMPFKDFYIYANTKMPLTASFSVTSLPKTEQISAYLVNTSNGTNIGTGWGISRSNFGSATIVSLNPSNPIQNGPVYVESALFSNPTVITSLSSNVYSTNGSMIPVLKYDMALTSTNYPFNATLFERPYLTLKLTSLNNVVDYITIQTESFYNRNGYYSQAVNGIDKRTNFYDKKYLQFDKTANEGNSFVPTTTTSVTRRSYLPGMKAGTKDNECETQFSFTTSTPTWLTTNTSPVYYNTTASTIVLTGITQFDISKFKSPGHILLQGIIPTSISTPFVTGDTLKYSYALFSYQTVVADTTAVNKFTFNGVKDLYLSYSGIVSSSRDSTEWTYFNFTTINAWFIEATTDGNIPLYPYYSPYLTAATITTATQISEYWEQDPRIDTLANFNHLPLTFKPHRKQSDIPVALFSSTGNHLFIGSNRITTEQYWDEYATLIVDRFNAELQYRNIKATLRRGSGIGEIIVTYPDGYSIEILNGKYDAITNTVTYPGNHKFIPDIGKSQSTTSPVFTKLAVRNNNDLNIKNEAYFSRRKIPEICSAESFVQIGAPDKEIIGYAENTDDLYVFKEDGIFRIIDAGTTSTNIPSVSVYQFSVNHICQAAGSIKEINDEIIFLSQYGFMSIGGGGIQNISGEILTDVLTLMQTSPKYRIRAFVNESKNLYYCTLINEIDETLDIKSGTYVFNTKTRQWSFMTEEIITGMEDHKKRNLVAYRQKSILAESIIGTHVRYDTYERLGFSSGQTTGITYGIDKFEIGYPVQTINKYRNFYSISRERHTNNIYQNAVDQYDFVSENYIRSQFISGIQEYNVNTLTNGFNIRIHDLGKRGRGGSTKTMSLLTYFVPRNMTMDLYPVSIYDEKIIVDSFLQYFVDRKVRAKMLTEYTVNGVTTEQEELVEIKITKVEYDDILFPSGYGTQPIITYTFEFLNGLPVNWSIKTLKEVQILCGVPAKITFNPESGGQPDSNKLFQEYMIHTETFNKAMAMNFKTDSKSTFLTNDRRFEYDPNATRRNVFRTYIPTSMSRGRYLIRQVKHDVPLENLIITGQTIVMRDSGSTRVQKDRDDN